MPLYEFKCVACDAQFELLIRDEAEPSCPACHGNRVTRLLSTFAVSSPATRQANVRRERQSSAKTQRDKSIADNEDALKHHH
jgi:putative FmdB family regulatory protein